MTNTAAIESLRSFAVSHICEMGCHHFVDDDSRCDGCNQLAAFAHMCTAALAGEEWAVERIETVLRQLALARAYHVWGGVDMEDAFTLRTIRATDATRPDESTMQTMTASLAEQLFRSAKPITIAELTERHLDMLQMSKIDLGGRVLLGDARDDIAEGRLDTNAVALVVAAFNARCGR